MRLSDLTIDPRSLGEKLWLVDVTPAYEYKDGQYFRLPLCRGPAGTGAGENQRQD